MNIAFDIDGVLTNILNFELEFGRDFFNREPINPNGFSVCELFDCNKINEKMFWAKNFARYSLREPAIIDSAKIIKRLKEEGDTIYIVTARAFAHRRDILGKIMRTMVEHWLENNGIIYDKIIYCKDDKKEAILNNNISVIIEDNVKNIKQLSEFIKVICMDWSYNTEAIGNNIYHANNYDEIYEIIKNINSETKEKVKIMKKL